MADVQVLAPGSDAAPLDYLIPGAQEIILKTLFASFDGSAAAAAFYPAIQLIAPGNVLAGTFKTQSTVAAGGSADVTFGPFLEEDSAGAASTSALAYGAVSRDTSQNIAANTQDQVKWTAFFTSDQTVFATGTAANPTTPNNTSGDTTLICQKDGAYLLRSSVIFGVVNGAFGYFRAAWLDGSPDQLNQILGPSMANYDPTGVSIPPGGGGGSNSLKLLDVRPLNIPGGVAPLYERVTVWNGDAALIHNVRFASLEAFYYGDIVPLGGGQVY